MLVFLLINIALGFIEDDDELFGSHSQLKVSIPLLQSYDGKNWEERGSIIISSQGAARRRKPSISITNNQFDKGRLDIEGFYYIKLQNPSGSSVYTALKTCNLISADLLDSIQLVINQDTFEVIGVNYSSGRTCSERTAAKTIESISSVLEVKEGGKPRFSSPKPLQDKQQPQSFFSKYWWVILLGLAFMTLSGGGPQQGAPGAARS